MPENHAAPSAADRYEAARIVDERCARAMAECVEMIDAVVTIGARYELHMVRDALQQLHAVATAAFEQAARMKGN